MNDYLDIDRQQRAKNAWLDIQKKELKASVASLEDYAEKTGFGLSIAKAEIDAIDTPKVRDIQNAHKAAFNAVYENAGNFRTTLGLFGGYISAEPCRTQREMEMLEKQSEFLWDRADSPIKKLEAAAFSHVHFERIHPFEDGNGRIGRILLDSSLRKSFGLEINTTQFFEADRGNYIGSMNECFKSQDLTPIMVLIGDAISRVAPEMKGIEIPDVNPSPFRLHPDMSMAYGETRELSREFEDSKNPAYFVDPEVDPYVADELPEPDPLNLRVRRLFGRILPKRNKPDVEM